MVCPFLKKLSLDLTVLDNFHSISSIQLYCSIFRESRTKQNIWSPFSQVSDQDTRLKHYWSRFQMNPGGNKMEIMHLIFFYLTFSFQYHLQWNPSGAISVMERQYKIMLVFFLPPWPVPGGIGQEENVLPSSCTLWDSSGFSIFSVSHLCGARSFIFLESDTINMLMILFCISLLLMY